MRPYRLADWESGVWTSDSVLNRFAIELDKVELRILLKLFFFGGRV